jgi:hypothetical protein
MKVFFDNKRNLYVVEMIDNELVTYLNTDDVAEAREWFIDRMTWMFNSAVNDKLAEDIDNK